MTIDRTAPQSDAATMSIHFAPEGAQQTSPDSATSSAAPITSTTTSGTPTSDHDPTERIETIEMKHKTNAEILDEFVRVTKAYPVEPTVEDREELRVLEEQRVKGLRDSKLSQEVKARVKREKELLEQARGDLAAQAG